MNQVFKNDKKSLTARVFIRSIGTVRYAIAEKTALDTSTIVASQHSLLQQEFLKVNMSHLTLQMDTKMD